jgi:predicted PurR-regulated permease PerM
VALTAGVMGAAFAPLRASARHFCSRYKAKTDVRKRIVALVSSYLPSQKAAEAGVSLIGLAALIALLYYGRPFFVALIISAMFGFILDPVVELVMQLRLPRPAAAAVVILVAVMAVYVLGLVLWRQLAHLSEDLPAYSTRMNELYDKASDEVEGLTHNMAEGLVPRRMRGQAEQIEQKPQAAAVRKRKTATPAPATPEAVTPALVQEVRIHTEQQPAISVVYGYVSEYFDILLMFSFVPFLVYFMLSWSDHVRKSVLQMFRGEERYMAGKSIAGVAELTRAYILGNFILGAMLAVVSALVFFLFGVPYWPLVGPLSGFLSLAPYVGLPLAVMPPLMAALAIPNKFTTILSLVLVVAALHLTALNVLYPKVVGKRVHLNPLVVTIALMFWSALWGGVGLLLAIPITAGIKAICDNVESMRPYGKLLGD